MRGTGQWAEQPIDVQRPNYPRAHKTLEVTLTDKFQNHRAAGLQPDGRWPGTMVSPEVLRS